MRYPLSGLLAIRDFRRDAAAKAVRAAEAAERAARKEAETRREAWEAYKLWRCDEVERRYRGIMGACLSGKDLDEFKAGLAQLGDEELRKESAVQDALMAVESARARVEAARQSWRKTDRECQKILYHREEWQKEAAKDAVRQEDLELEEFKPVLFVAEAEADTGARGQMTEDG